METKFLFVYLQSTIEVRLIFQRENCSEKRSSAKFHMLQKEREAQALEARYVSSPESASEQGWVEQGKIEFTTLLHLRRRKCSKVDIVAKM